MKLTRGCGISYIDFVTHQQIGQNIWKICADLFLCYVLGIVWLWCHIGVCNTTRDRCFKRGLRQWSYLARRKSTVSDPLAECTHLLLCFVCQCPGAITACLGEKVNKPKGRCSLLAPAILSPHWCTAESKVKFICVQKNPINFVAFVVPTEGYSLKWCWHRVIW